MKEIVQIANQFVRDLEDKHLSELRQKAEDRTNLREKDKCNCGSCRRQKDEKYWTDYYQEWERVKLSANDHEEDRLTTRALTKIEKKSDLENSRSEAIRLTAKYAHWDGTGSPTAYLDEVASGWREEGYWDDEEWLKEMSEWLKEEIKKEEDEDDDPWSDGRNGPNYV